MVCYNPDWKEQNEMRRKKKEEMRAQGINVDETSSLLSEGQHGWESDNKVF